MHFKHVMTHFKLVSSGVLEEFEDCNKVSSLPQICAIQEDEDT